jgi:hypothetical protein
MVLAAAATAQEKAQKTVMLVHGAFADGSSWDRVIPLLEAGGSTSSPCRTRSPRSPTMWRQPTGRSDAITGWSLARACFAAEPRESWLYCYPDDETIED